MQLLVLCLIPSIRAVEAESSEEYQDDMYDYAKPIGKSYKEQQRLYFQGDNFTVNLIPLVICGVILALMAVGACEYKLELIASLRVVNSAVYSGHARSFFFRISRSRAANHTLPSFPCSPHP